MGDLRARINSAFRSPASAAQAQLSQDAVKQSVASALKRVVSAPPVQVVRRPEDLGIPNPFAPAVPKGVTLEDGSIVVFADGAESVVDVFRTVFHELFHRGTKVRFTRNPDYITKMLEIAAADPMVQAEVEAWKKRDDEALCGWHCTRSAGAVQFRRGLASYFAYPPSPELRFGDEREQAELFARLAALYHGNPQRMQRELPTAYEAYHDLFGTTVFGAESRVLRDVRSDSAGRGAQGGRERAGPGADGGAVPGGRVRGGDSGLDALRATVARVFGASTDGFLIEDRQLESVARSEVTKDQTQTPACKVWFGDAKVRVLEGRPNGSASDCESIFDLLESKSFGLRDLAAPQPQPKEKCSMVRSRLETTQRLSGRLSSRKDIGSNNGTQRRRNALQPD